VSAVIDAVIDREDVDSDRIVLTGWSLGGYLSLRAASGEPRLPACVADPGLLSIGAGMVGRLRVAGVPGIERFPDIPASVLAPMAEAIHADRAQRWAVEQRGFWVHGVDTLGEYLRATVPFDLDGRLTSIGCPRAVTAAEDDPLSRSAEQVYDALPGTRTLLRFATAEGAGDHWRDAQPHPRRPAHLRLARHRTRRLTGTSAGQLRFSQEMRRRAFRRAGRCVTGPDARGVLEKGGARVTR